MSGPEHELYSRAEWAAIDGWTPASPSLSPQQPDGIARLRRTTAGGAVAAAVLLGLRDALEPPASEEVAVIQETEGDTDDPSAPVALRFDAASPAGTVVVVRGSGGEPGQSGGGRPQR